jgi:iron-sulfur cluster assembly protein/iron-sulfur cluster insertion protein
MSTTDTTQAPQVILLTPSAAEHIRSMQAEQPEHAGKPLRVYIENGGCSGLQYGMVFDELRADDRQYEFMGVTVLVDPVSADYLRGSTIDYSESLTGGGFKITNPNAKTSCGCGKSFEA